MAKKLTRIPLLYINLLNNKKIIFSQKFTLNSNLYRIKIIIGCSGQEDN